MTRTINVIAFVILIAGCGSSTTSERTEWRQRVAAIQILEPGELEGRRYEVLGQVVGKSCAQSASSTGGSLDELGTPDAAKGDSRLAAEKLGADAVTNFTCVTDHLSAQGMDRCTKRYRCTGQAIRFTD